MSLTFAVQVLVNLLHPGSGGGGTTVGGGGTTNHAAGGGKPHYTRFEFGATGYQWHKDTHIWEENDEVAL